MAKNKGITEDLENKPQNGFLTLKEASEISNYSPDYIGQLIRAGKIEGKQIYSNVAWVTTETALRNYMEKKGKDVEHMPAIDSVYALPNLFRPLLYGVILVSVVFLLVLMYVFSVTLDRAISSSYEQDVVTKSDSL